MSWGKRVEKNILRNYELSLHPQVQGLCVRMCCVIIWSLNFAIMSKAETKGGKELWRKDFVKLANKEDKKSSGDKIAQIWA